jgi:hypothetical protein
MDALMTPDEAKDTSFTGIPDRLLDTLKDVGETKGLMTLRDVCDEVATDFCNDLDAGLKIYPWPQPDPGGGYNRVTVRFSIDVRDRMKETARRHKARLGTFFIVGAIRWLDKNGVRFPPETTEDHHDD